MFKEPNDTVVEQSEESFWQGVKRYWFGEINFSTHAFEVVVVCSIFLLVGVFGSGAITYILTGRDVATDFCGPCNEAKTCIGAQAVWVCAEDGWHKGPTSSN